MASLGADWYSLNGLRLYPLDDAASGRDDLDRALPPGLLVDARIRFPSTLGSVAVLLAATLSPRIVTLLFGVTSTRPTDPSQPGPPPTPIASLTLTSRPELFRHYALTPLTPGVGGFVVLGPAAHDTANLTTPLAMRFSRPDQSALLARCASSYRPIPVASLRKQGAGTRLGGIVTLAGTGDLEVLTDVREVGGNAVPAVVIRLSGETARTTLTRYAGPCGGRPESGTCPAPPIASVSGIAPDCDGDLRIRFLGVEVLPLTVGGLALDLPIGLAASCREDTIISLEPVDDCPGDPVPRPDPSPVIPVGTPLPTPSPRVPTPTPTPTPPPGVTPSRYVYEINDSLTNPRLRQPGPTGTSWDYGSALNPSPRGPTWKSPVMSAPVFGATSADDCTIPSGLTAPNIAVPVKYELACSGGKPRLYITYPVCTDGDTPTRFKRDGTLWLSDAFFLADPASTPGLKTVSALATISCNINEPAGWLFRMNAPALYGSGTRTITVYRTAE